MSTPLRASRGGSNQPRGLYNNATSRGARGGRGHFSNTSSRGGRAGAINMGATSNPTPEGHSQAPRAGRARRGAGRGQSTRGASSMSGTTGKQTQRGSSPSGPPPSSATEYMNQMQETYNSLKSNRDQERAKAIRDGFLADPERKTTLDQAITPVGTCTDMCPEFERVQRVVQNAVDRTERVHNEAMGRDLPAEERMVKRFRRSAAGDDEQLPSDIRTPATLKRSLDYLINEVIGAGENLAIVHKFVWDRTRSIRNDFSIQQVSKPEDVQLAVECFERIARFHILSMHQLSNPDNLPQGGNFDAHQEREQLNNTLLSLMYYYDDHRTRQTFKHEAEFRAYCIILEMQATHPDLQDRMQAWPQPLLQSLSVRNAFQLHAAASNTLLDQGPLKPSTPFLIAQGNYEGFWKRMKSFTTPYLVACLAESHFGQVRYMALQNIWKSNKKAPAGQQKTNKQWNLDELTRSLAFDDYDQTRDFCGNFGLGFVEDGEDLEYLDFSSLSSDTLSPNSAVNRQVFSHDVVEKKRFWRTFAAVMNGVPVGQAIREGLVAEGSISDVEDDPEQVMDTEDSLFLPEKVEDSVKTFSSKPSFNPSAPAFMPVSSTQPSTAPEAKKSIFGSPSTGGGFGSGQPGSSVSTAKTMFGTPSISGVGTAQPGSSMSKTTGIFGTPSITSGGLGTGQTGVPSINPFGNPANPSNPPSTRWGAVSQSAPVSSPTAQAPFSSVANPSPFSGLSGNAPSSSVPSIFGKPPDALNQSAAVKAAPQPAPSQWTLFEPEKRPSSRGTAVSPSESSDFRPPSPSRPQGIGISEAVPEPPPSPRPKTLELPKPSQAAPPPFNFGPAPTISAPTASSNTLFGTPQTPSSNISDQTVPSENEDKGKGKGKEREASSQISFTPTHSFQPASTSFQTSSGLPGTVNETKPSTLSSPFWPTVSPHANNGASCTTDQSHSEAIPPPTEIPLTPKAAVPTSTFTKSAIPQSYTPTGPPRRLNFDPKPRTSSPLSQPPELVPQSPDKPVTTPKPPQKTLNKGDRARLSETVARLALTEPRGLLQQFVEYKAIDIVQSAIKQFEQEEFDNQVSTFVFLRLARKYGLHWKNIAYKRKLNRRAKHRRSVFAETMRQENLKRQKGDAELQAILQAQKERERIQAAQQRESQESPVPESATSIRSFESVPSAAGKKRKSLSREFSEHTAPHHDTVSNGHKRSRTLGGLNDVRDTRAQSRQPTDTPPNRFLTSSTLSGRSILLEYPDSAEIQAAARNRKVDRTNTDYFRLKARGIDPETKIVPHTKESLERKRRREDDEKDAVEQSSTWSERRKRASTITERVNPLLAKVLQTKPSISPPPPTGTRHVSAPTASITVPSLSKTMSPATTRESKLDDDDDDLLRQIREVRSALSTDTEWFKEQAEQIQEEERRSSELGSNNGRLSNSQIPAVSESSMAGRVNGYEFTPSASVMSSRSEQRLRRTGGYGLANRAVEDYLPGGSRYIPAMSKRSAAAMMQASTTPDEVSTRPSPPKRSRGKRNDVDPTYRYESNQDDEDWSDIQPVYHRERNSPAQQVETADFQENDLEVVEDHANENHYDAPRYDFGETETYDNGQYAGSQVWESTEANVQDEALGQSVDDQSGDYEEEEDEGTGYVAEDEDPVAVGEEEEEMYDEEFDEEDEGEEDEDEEEDDEAEEEEVTSLHPARNPFNSQSQDSSRSGSGSQGFGGSISGTGPGATQDDALVLSD